MKRKAIKIIIIISVVLIIVVGLYIYNENKYKLKNIKKIYGMPPTLLINKDDILIPYTEYLKKEKKVNKSYLGNIRVNSYGDYRYSVFRDGHSLLFLFYDNNADIIANFRVPFKFIPLEKYVKELNKSGIWEKIVKLDPLTYNYDLDDKYFITEHLLINGDVLVIKYEGSQCLEYTIYPRLAKEYLDVIKEILKEL